MTMRMLLGFASVLQKCHKSLLIQIASVETSMYQAVRHCACVVRCKGGAYRISIWWLLGNPITVVRLLESK